MRKECALLAITLGVGAIIYELVWITATWEQSARMLTTSQSRANATDSYVVYDSGAHKWNLVLVYPECTLTDYYTTRPSALQALHRAITTDETIYHTPDCGEDHMDFTPDCMTADQWDDCRRAKNKWIEFYMVWIGLVIFVVEFFFLCVLVGRMIDPPPRPPNRTNRPHPSKPPTYAPVDNVVELSVELSDEPSVVTPLHNSIPCETSSNSSTLDV